MRITRRIAVASLMAVALADPRFRRRQADHPGLGAGPDVSVLRPHDEGLQGRGARSRASTCIESDGQVSSPKQTADIEAALAKGVKGIVLSPNEVDAMAPALQEAVDAKVPVVTVDRRVPSVTGILAPCRRRQRQGRRGAGQSGRQAVPERRDDHQPAGPVRREPGDRPQQGPAQRARQGGRQIQDRVRADRRLRPRQGPVGHRSRARRHGDAAAGHRRRQRRHGARRAGGGQGAQPQGHRHHRLRRAARGAGARCATASLDRDDRAVPRPSRARIGVQIAGRLPQERQEAGAAGHPADAGRRSPRTISTRPSASAR